MNKGKPRNELAHDHWLEYGFLFNWPISFRVTGYARLFKLVISISHGGHHDQHNSESQNLLLQEVFLHLFQWNSASTANFGTVTFQLFIFTIFLLTKRQTAQHQEHENVL